MGRYEIKNKSKGKSEEICVVAREATRCMEDSGMMVMPDENRERPVKSEECRVAAC